MEVNKTYVFHRKDNQEFIVDEDVFFKEKNDFLFKYARVKVNAENYCEEIYNNDSSILLIRYEEKKLSEMKQIHECLYQGLNFELIFNKSQIADWPLIEIKHSYSSNFRLLESIIGYASDKGEYYSLNFDEHREFIGGEILIYEQVDNTLRYALEYNESRELFNCFDFKLDSNISVNSISIKAAYPKIDIPQEIVQLLNP